jgi:predicted RNA-binding protein with TRAM domain
MPPHRPSAPITRGDRVTAPVTGLGDGPDGIAKVDDYIVFVPGVLPGEEATFDVTSAARKHGRGELVSVQRPSPDRVKARCAHFLQCGGCHRQHQRYDAQLLSKQHKNIVVGKTQTLMMMIQQEVSRPKIFHLFPSRTKKDAYLNCKQCALKGFSPIPQQWRKIKRFLIIGKTLHSITAIVFSIDMVKRRSFRSYSCTATRFFPS